MIEPKLLALLACPRCASRPALEIDREQLVCTLCRYRYPVIDGIPHLLIEEASPPEPTESEPNES